MDVLSALIKCESAFMLKNTPIKRFQLNCDPLYVGYWAMPDF